jgi:preprotein translocase subunit SecG
MLDVLRILLFVVFGLSSLILIVVILLQEGKGGGLASAFGGAGADTFGVRSGGINRFTTILAGVWIVAAVILAASSPTTVVRIDPKDADSGIEGPEEPGGNEEDAPKEEGSEQPAKEDAPK